MSKFIDNLNRLSQVEPQPMGFVRHTVPTKPKLQLIAAVSMTDDDIARYVAGADAAIFSFNGAEKESSRLRRLAEESPAVSWGAWFKEGNIPEMNPAELSEFVVFPASSPLSLLEGKEPGRVISIDPAIHEGLLRAVNDLPVDAVLADKPAKDCLDCYDLLVYQRFAAVLAKPLLVWTPAPLTPNELELLWDAGVDGIVVETVPGRPELIREVRETIDKMDFPTRRRERAEATLPRLSMAAAGEEEAEEEEEDEDE